MTAHGETAREGTPMEAALARYSGRVVWRRRGVGRTLVERHPPPLFFTKP